MVPLWPPLWTRVLLQLHIYDLGGRRQVWWLNWASMYKVSKAHCVDDTDMTLTLHRSKSGRHFSQVRNSADQVIDAERCSLQSVWLCVQGPKAELLQQLQARQLFPDVEFIYGYGRQVRESVPRPPIHALWRSLHQLQGTVHWWRQLRGEQLGYRRPICTRRECRTCRGYHQPHLRLLHQTGVPRVQAIPRPRAGSKPSHPNYKQRALVHSQGRDVDAWGGTCFLGRNGHKKTHQAGHAVVASKAVQMYATSVLWVCLHGGPGSQHRQQDKC